MRIPSEKRVFEIGREILARARDEEARWQAGHRWETALLDWCMRHEEIRNRTFRFIDVFPSLKKSGAIHRHLQEYFPGSEHRLPAALRAGLVLTRPALLTQGILSQATRILYNRMAALFIGASNEKEALNRLREFDAQGYRLSMDLLGEKTMSEAEADSYRDRYENLIRTLGGEHKGLGRQNVSVKLSALDPCFDPLDAEGSSRRVRERLRPLMRLARELEVFIHIDMEDYEVRDLTLKIMRDLLREEEFRSGVETGIVLQAYLKDARECFERILEWSRTLRRPLTVRLVRGAYWDSEIMKAQERHWPSPVFLRKPETDRMYEELSRHILEHHATLRLAAATHNVRSLAWVLALAEENPPVRDDFEFQVLYGMGASLMAALKEAGRPPRIYMPVGDSITGMAYLVRRLLENVSSQSFVRSGIHNAAPEEASLHPPSVDRIGKEPAVEPKETGAFRPAAALRFHQEETAAEFRLALDKVRLSLGVDLHAEISGRKCGEGPVLENVSPIDGEIPVCRVRCASPAEAGRAMEAARKAAAGWRNEPAGRRADCLRRAAQWMTDRRMDLAALEVFEVGKPWREADMDVVEAIDFLNFYAAQAEAVFTETPTDRLYRETNVTVPCGRGPTVVIAPWNFPIAILTGMTSAALAAGNPVIMKPAEQSMLTAWKVYEALRAGGIPAEALHFLPGTGEDCGAALTAHPAAAVIAFTGSREVGLKILETANARNPEKELITKCIVEMGGKNAGIVDASADFDRAIPEILSSAFGFAGQKCSALSRLYIHEDVYDVFTPRLAAAAACFPAALPLEPGTLCGPVIDEEARERIRGIIERGKREGRVVFEGKTVPSGGYYVPPVILEGLPRHSPVVREEIFGPVLCLLRVSCFEEALNEANGGSYALTGGVFSRTPSHLEAARRNMEAGNVYLNRGITGARVGRQPFGGFKLSGGGAKAGGVDYLREFTVTRTVTEDISRHGFAPLADPDEEV